MSNPLFNKFGPSQNYSRMNPLQMANLFRQVQSNPSKITDLLLQNGRINKQQYDDMQKFGGNPEAIAKYLLENGTMTQQDISNIQSVIPKS